MTKKPSKIVKIEKAYNITLESVAYDDVNFWEERNCYDVDEDWNVFALNLHGSGIEDLNPLLDLKVLKFLDLSHNSIVNTDELSILSKLEILDLSYNEITSFNFSTLSNIRILKLNGNTISNIESVSELDTLVALHLSDNDIHTINDLSQLTQLKKLDLADNVIEDISFLELLSGLEVLDLSTNAIKDINELSNLVHLEELNLNTNNLKNVENLNDFYNLERLALGENNISNISFLKDLRRLKYLDLSSNRISDITDLDGLIQLETLDISGNSISDLLYLSGLVYLKELDLGENKISDISYLRYLKRLKYLYLRDNKVSEIDALLELEQLEYLILNSNNLTNIEGIGELSSINYLDLADNQISDLKPLSLLTEIEGLNVNNNQITDITPLLPLVHLVELYLNNNKISSVEGLSKLLQLETLILSNNAIETVEELFLLPKLKALNLEGNKVSIVKVLSFSNNLRYLNLRNNTIENLQSISSILDIETLKHIEISNNPIVEALDLRISSTKDYLELLKSKLKEQEDIQKKITLPVKVMLLGNHASGKSTFLEYLQTGGNIKNRSNSTPILKIEDYYSETQKKGTLPKAIIYDFGGQDYYHGMYQAFFSLDSINLLLWNKKTDKNAIRPDSDNLNTRDFSKRYWLAQLQYAFNRERKNYEENSDEPTFLVQTYADTDEKESWVNKIETQKVTNEFYVSLLDDKQGKSKVNEASLNYLKASLLHEIERKQIEEEKPIWYKPFLNYIIKRDTASSTKLTTIIKNYNRDNLTEEEKQQFLQVDLEQLALKGMILYYRHDKELKDIAWLNPSKTVEYIHKTILNKALVKKEKGKLETKDWKRICPDSRLERLLIIEKVIFFDQDNAHYIIPNYLPLAQDDEHYNLLSFGFIEPNFTLKFKYFIPFGIINQLICRFGNNPDYKTFWRDQLIFTYKKAKVFIKLSFETLTISVFIQRNKPEELEQELFDIILKLYNNDAFEMSLSDRLSEELETIKESDKYEKRALESISNYELEHLSPKTETTDKLKNLRFIRKGVNPVKEDYKYDSPDDMYLSTDGKYFVHHKTLENSELTQTKISAFPLNEKGHIDDSKPKEQSSIIYTNFTNNDKIKQMKKIFISYSRKDVDYKNELKNHLGMLRLFDIADTWSCEDISIGKWDTQIQKELEESDLIIYMLSANFFSSRYIIEKEVANIMKEIEEGKEKDILCVVVSDFVGVETLKSPSDDRPTTALQNALLELAAHQYLPYDSITNKTSTNTEEKIIPLKVHTNRNTIESALTQIVSKVREKLQ